METRLKTESMTSKNRMQEGDRGRATNSMTSKSREQQINKPTKK